MPHSIRTYTGEETVRILIVDDNQAFAEALTLTLGTVDGFEVVGSARDGLEALALAPHLEPDVVVMDLQMPVLDGIDATRRLRNGTPCAVVAHSGAAPPEDIERAFEAGAAAFVPKGESLLELARTIVRVAHGQRSLPRRPLEAAGRSAA